MENTLENKEKFFAQYWGQPCSGIVGLKNKLIGVEIPLNNIGWLELKPLSSITDEDLIHVARLAHQMETKTFKVERKSDIFYCTSEPDKVGIYYFISMMPKYATVCSTMNFLKNKEDKFESFTVNIGKINQSSARPIPYIIIVDYLRSKGYALPYMGLSVEKLIEYGWVKIKEA